MSLLQAHDTLCRAISQSREMSLQGNWRESYKHLYKAVKLCRAAGWNVKWNQWNEPYI